MPIYDFKCECGTEFEEYKHKFVEDDTAACPVCSRQAQRAPSMNGTNFNAIDLKCQRLFGHKLNGQWVDKNHK